MNMLPNDHHPGPRCSCAECLRKYPDAQPPSKKLCYGVNISSEADALITEYGNANFDCGDYRDDDGDGDGQYLAISNKTAEHGAALAQYVERLQRKVADLELIKAGSDKRSLMLINENERLTAALKRYDADPDACTADGIPCVSHMALLGLQDELQAVRAQPAPPPLSIAAIRSVIAEMVAVAADGDRDEADWTADNCAQIDAWQVRLAEAVAGQAQGEPDGH